MAYCKNKNRNERNIVFSVNSKKQKCQTRRNRQSKYNNCACYAVVI